eukprot:1151588-Pelagomonas_calceolata.AAC.6
MHQSQVVHHSQTLRTTSGRLGAGLVLDVRTIVMCYAWKSYVMHRATIEGSTQLSSKAGPKLFGAIQEIHDVTMREAIGLHSGLEITTEGDSMTCKTPYAMMASVQDLQYPGAEVATLIACSMDKAGLSCCPLDVTSMR